MPDTVFYFVLNMSITASVIGCVLMILRKTRVIPSFGTYLLWSLVLIRLLVPFSVSSPLSLFNVTGQLIKRVVTLSEGGEGKVPDLTFTNSIGAAESYFPVIYRNDLMDAILRAAAHIWVIVAAAAFLTALVLYGLTGSELKKARHVSGRLYQTDRIATPMTYGILKPRIIIPASLSGDTDALAHILRHEEVHIRRRDNLWRLLGVGAACVHWFNPLAWLFLKAFFQDMELACDAKVIKSLLPTERKAYAGVLLSCQAGRKMLMSTAFSGSHIRVRIENVITYRKLTILSSVALMLFLAAVSWALLTNPVR